MKRLAQTLVLLIVAAVPAYAGGPVAVTPEPATIGLVATGAGVLGIAAWIRRRKR